MWYVGAFVLPLKCFGALMPLVLCLAPVPAAPWLNEPFKLQGGAGVGGAGEVGGCW